MLRRWQVQALKAGEAKQAPQAVGTEPGWFGANSAAGSQGENRRCTSDAPWLYGSRQFVCQVLEHLDAVLQRG